MYGQRSHLVTAEYWRWWVVHLWVEGFFEVFATVVIAFLFTRLKLLEIRTATKPCAVLDHHLSSPAESSAPSITCTSPVQRPQSSGLGAIFSAFEVVPLVLIGFEAWENIRLARRQRSPNGSPITSGPSTSLWQLHFGILWERVCSASSSTRPSRSTTCRGST
jgi:nitric oxide reductase subunit B